MHGLLMSLLACSCIIGASELLKTTPVETSIRDLPDAYDLPADVNQVRELYDCADFIAVGTLERVEPPLVRLGGGTSAQQVAIYHLDAFVKGKLEVRQIPVYHLTDDSPYAQGDRLTTGFDGFELDRTVFQPGLKLLLFLRSWCLPPEVFGEPPDKEFGELLGHGGLMLSRGYAIKFYTISSQKGVYLWTPDAEERIRKAIKEVPAQGKPNPACPFSKPGEFGPPCPPEVMISAPDVEPGPSPD